MSSRLGRNPLKTPKPAKKASKSPIISATEIVEEMNEQLEREQLVEEKAPQETLPKTPLERLAHWLFVDIRADSYVFGLKSILLIKTVWD
jgi:hypothetical protein